MYSQLRRFVFVGLLFAAPIAAPLAAQDAPQRQQVPPRANLAFVDVNVVPMDRDVVLPAHTVIVRDGRIAAMGPSASTQVPAGAQRIDGRGQYLMPGLAEMHGHMPNGESTTLHNYLFLYLANGITTVRGMQGAPYHITLRDQLAAAELLGPRFFPAGPQLSANSAATPAAARAAVERQKSMGFNLLKIQEGVSPVVYDTIVSVARALGIPFGGHVPDAVGLWKALDARQVTVDHLDNYMETVQAADFPADKLALVPESRVSDPVRRRIAALAEATRRAGVAVVPTMPLWEVLYTPPDSAELAARPDLRYVSPLLVSSWFSQLSPRIPPEGYAAWKQMRNSILKALSDAGVTILLGTDSPQRMSVPGFSIHYEMKSMAAAGMTPYQILRSGTWNVAQHLGLLAESGSVAVGKRADLVLVTANPLADVDNVAKRAGVMVDGRWLPEPDIQSRLQAIANSYSRE
jgi:imidazolonepropionase-like amidohydrolase